MADHVVVGVGLASSATAREVGALVDSVLASASLARPDVVAVATTERLAGDARVTGLGWPVHGWPPSELAAVDAPTPSVRTLREIGTTSVAEAAALLGAGPGAVLLVAKRTSAHATAAVAASTPGPGAAGGCGAPR